MWIFKKKNYALISFEQLKHFSRELKRTINYFSLVLHASCRSAMADMGLTSPPTSPHSEHRLKNEERSPVWAILFLWQRTGEKKKTEMNQATIIKILHFSLQQQSRRIIEKKELLGAWSQNAWGTMNRTEQGLRKTSLPTLW